MGGGYIGDTVLSYREHYSKNEQDLIYLYELDKRNIITAKRILKNHQIKNIKYRPVGISDCKKTVGVSLGLTTGSHIGEATGAKHDFLEVSSLDEDIKEKITFIKLDIEGQEAEGLRGAKRHISLEKPKLAICVYHKYDDLWKLSELILEINPKYEFYLRHYTSGPYETVLYAI